MKRISTTQENVTASKAPPPPTLHSQLQERISYYINHDIMHVPSEDSDDNEGKLQQLRRRRYRMSKSKIYSDQAKALKTKDAFRRRAACFGGRIINVTSASDMTLVREQSQSPNTEEVTPHTQTPLNDGIDADEGERIETLPSPLIQ